MSAVAKNIRLDWGKIISTLGLTGTTSSSLLAFRKRHEEAKKKIFDLSQQSTEVDFSSYRSQLQNQKVVDDIEKAYKAFKPVTYDVSKQLKTIEAFEAKALENAEATQSKVTAELEQLQKALDDITSARPFEQLSIEDLEEAAPEIDKKVVEVVTKSRYEMPEYKDKFGSTAFM